MLERSGNELTLRFWRMNVTNAGLCIPLQLLQCHANTFAMRFAHTIIATHKGRKRNRLGCGERRIPSCTMFRAGDLLTIAIVVGPGGLVLDELRIVRWVPSFAQTSKLFSPYVAMHSPLLCKAPLPLAMSFLIAAPVVLSFRGELARVIRSCLSSR